MHIFIQLMIINEEIQVHKFTIEKVMKIKQKFLDKHGFTIVEFIVTMAVMSIFFLGVTLILSSGSKIYLTETVAGNNQEAVTTIMDDITNYVMYGEDVRVFYRLSEGETKVSGKIVMGADASWFTEGTEVYLDPKNDNKLIFDNMSGTKDAVILPGAGVTGQLTSGAEFYGNGIDLGYKKIYLVSKKIAADNYEGESIYGLSFGSKYYRGLNLKLQIRDKGVVAGDAGKKGIYMIKLTGIGKMAVASSEVSVEGLNRN